MTQPELGRVVGRSGRTIGNWENGRTVPTSDELDQIEAHFEANPVPELPVEPTTDDELLNHLEANIAAAETRLRRAAGLTRLLQERRKSA
jgi:transcriptional regulator with XRE-family HTH domain